MIYLQSKINEAYSIISRVNEKSNEHPLICNFSGGKDSQVLLSLMLDVTDNVEALYMVSGIDLPGSVDHVKREIKKYGIKLHFSDPIKDFQGDFAYWVRKFGYFPGPYYYYCSSRLKLRPARNYFRKIYGMASLYKFNGVRRFESSRRKKIYPVSRGFIINDDEHSGSYVVMPLLNWTDNEVKEFLKRREITINQNYKVCGVSGCYYCPFYQPYFYYRINERFPGIYNEIITLEKELEKPSVIGNRFLYKLLQQTKLDEYLDMSSAYQKEEHGLTDKITKCRDCGKFQFEYQQGIKV